MEDEKGQERQTFPYVNEIYEDEIQEKWPFFDNLIGELIEHESKEVWKFEQEQDCEQDLPFLFESALWLF